MRLIERFRRRLASTEGSAARFIIGGNPSYVGRPSGIVEETILSLALKQPIYVAGEFGGAASDLGIVLGLARLRTGEIPESLRDHLSATERSDLERIKTILQPPPLTDLPVYPDDQVGFLHAHELGGEKWPDNGLTVDENRKLFTTASSADAAQLVVTGLSRRFQDH